MEVTIIVFSMTAFGCSWIDIISSDRQGLPKAPPMSTKALRYAIRGVRAFMDD